MVCIHGGGFAYGSGGQPIYCGEDLARDHDVVVVSVNHRLNLFGYLHLGDAFGDAYKSSGTVGMQDLVLALEWVRDNIAGFGGDPGNVTVMGQSGGGAKDLHPDRRCNRPKASSTRRWSRAAPRFAWARRPCPRSSGPTS